jgi:hypothetical protein
MKPIVSRLWGIANNVPKPDINPSYNKSQALAQNVAANYYNNLVVYKN